MKDGAAVSRDGKTIGEAGFREKLRSSVLDTPSLGCSGGGANKAGGDRD